MRILQIIVLLFSLFLLSSCSTKKQYIEVPVEIETVRTEYINKLYKDSVFVHDSIDRYIQGDTVFVSKYKYIYKYMNRTDTVCRTDSIQIPVEVKTIQIQEVEKPLKWWQKTLMYTGIVLLLSLIIAVVIWIKR